MTLSTYRRCARCIMDTSVEDIYFDAAGICNYCHQFDTDVIPNWYPNEEGRRFGRVLLARLKPSGAERNTIASWG